jgi:hypothetical protein
MVERECIVSTHEFRSICLFCWGLEAVRWMNICNICSRLYYYHTLLPRSLNQQYLLYYWRLRHEKTRRLCMEHCSPWPKPSSLWQTGYSACQLTSPTGTTAFRELDACRKRRDASQRRWRRKIETRVWPEYTSSVGVLPYIPAQSWSPSLRRSN